MKAIELLSLKVYLLILTCVYYTCIPEIRMGEFQDSFFLYLYCIYGIKESTIEPLKVGSCPNDDNSVQILFCPFLCSI